MEDDENKETVQEQLHIGHDGDNDDMDAVEDLEEMNDFFGLKKIEDTDVKV